MLGYQVALIHKDEHGIVSRPLIVLNLAATDEEAAMIEARTLAREHRPHDANAFDLVLDGHLIVQERLD